MELVVGLVVLGIILKVLLGPREVEGPQVQFCQFCEARFLSSRSLSYHVQAAHPELWEDG